MVFRNVGDVLNLASPEDPPPQEPRRSLGDHLKVRHVVAGLVVAAILVLAGWGVVIAFGKGVFKVVSGVFG